MLEAITFRFSNASVTNGGPVLGLSEHSVWIVTTRPMGAGEEAWNWETRQLVAAGKEVFGDAMVIDPTLVSTEFPEDSSPCLYASDRSLAPPRALVVRSARQAPIACAVLQTAVERLGTVALDPVDRFGWTSNAKVRSTASRHARAAGSTTEVVFDPATARSALARWRDRLPFVIKSTEGRGGEDVLFAETVEEAGAWIGSWFERNPSIALLLQADEHFIEEYRVILLSGRSIGIAQKGSTAETRARNAAQGVLWQSCRADDVVDFCESRSEQRGMIGSDVGRRVDGSLVIIEENRAPGWKAFQTATSVPVAMAVMEHLRAIRPS